MDPVAMDLHLARQEGVITRRQVLGAGGDDNYIERQIRRRAWVTVHRGVYLDHTGEPTWGQRAWAAVLFYWPAALCHESALVEIGPGRNPDPTQPIHVAIEHPRSAAPIHGVTLHRLSGLSCRVRWNLGPPRLVLEEAVLDVCAGATSVLEYAYLRMVERAHRLPTARRQLRYRTVGGTVYRDVEYDEFRLVVELDGRVGHERARDRWHDQDRDLDAAAEEDKLTVRIGWAHAEDQPCLTALRIGRLLQRRGWTGAPKPCGPGCLLAGSETPQPVGFPARGAGNPTRNYAAAGAHGAAAGRPTHNDASAG